MSRSLHHHFLGKVRCTKASCMLLSLVRAKTPNPLPNVVCGGVRLFIVLGEKIDVIFTKGTTSLQPFHHKPVLELFSMLRVFSHRLLTFPPHARGQALGFECTFSDTFPSIIHVLFSLKDEGILSVKERYIST